MSERKKQWILWRILVTVTLAHAKTASVDWPTNIASELFRIPELRFFQRKACYPLTFIQGLSNFAFFLKWHEGIFDIARALFRLRVKTHRNILKFRVSEPSEKGTEKVTELRTRPGRKIQQKEATRERPKSISINYHQRLWCTVWLHTV